MKITIHTSIWIEGEDRTETKHCAWTEHEFKMDEEIKSILDIHNEKVGAIERKILK